MADEPTDLEAERQKRQLAKLLKNEPPHKPAQWIPYADWDLLPVPEQEWTVPDRIPKRQVCLFSGEGATGKSTVALHLASAIALGRDWLGSTPDQGPTFFIDAEDDLAILHRRLDALRGHFGCSFTDLAQGGLNLMSRVGEDAILASAAPKSGLVVPTQLYKEILTMALELKPRLIVLASLANVWSGNEIDRSQVQQFIALLTKLALAANGSVLLLSHPSLTGLANKSGISGSTQWHNSVRARWYLTSPESQDGEAKGELRELKFMKNQYGPVSEAVILRYQHGLFLPDAQGSPSFVKLARQQALDELFMSLLVRYLKQGTNLSPKPKSNGYAPSQLAKEQQAVEMRAKKPELEAAMLRLYAAGKLQTVSYGKPSNPHERIDITRPDPD